MGKYLGSTGLTYLWGKIKELFTTGTAGRAQGIPFGKVDSTSTATAFTATVEGITELKNGTCVYLMNGVVTSAAASTAPKCWTLNINNLGAKPVYVTTAAATYSTTHFTKNYKMLFTYDTSLNSGNGGWYIGQLFNSNTTYSDMTQAEIDAGTGTTGRKITPKMLRDNFYTEDEVDTLLGSKANSNDLATVATSGSYNDLDDTPTIPTKVSDLTNDSGFTTNIGTITSVKMNGSTISSSGEADLGTVITSHQDISGKVDKVSLTTDNAIARYDGTTGDLQNSGVTIDDDGNITAASFVTSGGNAIQIIKGDGSLSDVYLMPYNSFADNKNKIYNHLTDNWLAGFNKKAEARGWVCTRKLYDSNNTFVEDLPMTLFDGAYEHYNQKVLDDTTEKVYLGTVDSESLSGSSSSFTTYGDGYLYVSFYSTFLPESLTARVYTKSNNVGKWNNVSFTAIKNNVYKASLASIVYPCAIEITCVGKTYTIGSLTYGASISQIEWVRTRSEMADSSVIVKYPVAQEMWGNLTVPKLIVRGGTSSQFLKADGSLEEFSHVVKEIGTNSTFTNYIYGKYLNYNGQEVIDADWCYVDDYIQVSPSSSITWKYGGTNATGPVLYCYNANKGRVDYWSANNASGERTFTVNSSTYYVRLSFRNSTTDAYIKAGGIILWKREDVAGGVIGLSKRIDEKVSSTNVTSIVKITQAAYDLLESPSSTTLYIITG